MATATLTEPTSKSRFQDAIDMLVDTIALATRHKNRGDMATAHGEFAEAERIFRQETKYKPAAALRSFVAEAPKPLVEVLLAGFRAFTRKNLTLMNLGDRDDSFNVFLSLCAKVSINQYYLERQRLFADIAGLGGNVPYMTLEQCRQIEARLARVTTASEWVNAGFVNIGEHMGLISWHNSSLPLTVRAKAPHAEHSLMCAPKPEFATSEKKVRPARIVSAKVVEFAAEEMFAETGKLPNLGEAPGKQLVTEKDFVRMSHEERLAAGWKVNEKGTNGRQVVYVRGEGHAKETKTVYLPVPKQSEADKQQARAAREAKQKGHQAARAANAPKGNGSKKEEKK